MTSFPALPSGNNPYAATAAGYASSAASVYNAIRAAAAQHEQQVYKRKQDEAALERGNLQQAFENENKLRQEGGQLQDNGPLSTADPAGRIGLTRPPNTDSDSAPRGGGQLVTEPVSGRQYYMPSASEKEQAALNDSNSFVPTGQLGAMLEGAGVKPGRRIKAADSHSILMALNEAQPKDEPYDIDTSGKFQDAQGNPAAVMIGRKTGNVRMLNFSGQQQPRPQSAQAGDQYDLSKRWSPPGYDMSQVQGGQPGGAFALPDKPDATELLSGYQGPGGGPVLLDKNKRTTSEVPLPPGAKQVMTPAQTEADKDRHVRQAELQDTREARRSEADQRRADAQQVRENQAAKDHEAAGIKKQAMQAMAQAFHDAAGTNAGENYFPPRYVNGIVVPGPVQTMPTDPDKLAARRKQLESAAAGFEQTAKTHQAEQERIEKAHGWGKFAAPSGQGAGTSGTSAAPAQPVNPGRGGRGGTAPAKAAPAIAEGTIIRNPTTGARQILRGGQWKPL